MGKNMMILEKYLEFRVKFSPEIVANVINGAGPYSKGHLVRDTLFYKFNVTDAANIHDFLYSQYGLKEVSRKEADRMFLRMMLNRLKTHNALSRFLNKPLVYSYYAAVRLFGNSFWTKEKIDW